MGRASEPSPIPRDVRSYVMSNDPSPTDPELTDRAARRRRTGLAWGALLLVLVGAVVSFVLAHLGAPVYDAGDEHGATTETGAEHLRRHAVPEKPVPAGAIDVLVVERGTETPVEAVEVALVAELRDDAVEAVTGITGADGRVRLRGEFPGFLEIRSDRWTSDPMPPRSKVT